MPKMDKQKIVVSDQTFEIRHEPSGTFLDVRGSVADFIRDKNLFNHWRIDSNVINFSDTPENPKREGAFIGYKSVGYVVYNADTHDFFPDRATSFWKKLQEIKEYKIPKITRFGARTRVYIPNNHLTFEEINSVVFKQFFTSEIKDLLGGDQKDVQFIITLKEKQFTVLVSGGPMKKDEPKKHFNFDSEYFEKCGLFLDLDFSDEKITHDQVPRFLHEAIDLTWEKIERIASKLGF